MKGKIDRRGFLGLMGIGIAGGAWPGAVRVSAAQNIDGIKLPAGWLEPPPEFSLVPFWFWNDALSFLVLSRNISFS